MTLIRVETVEGQGWRIRRIVTDEREARQLANALVIAEGVGATFTSIRLDDLLRLTNDLLADALTRKETTDV